jgi:hypothetical protein
MHLTTATPSSPGWPAKYSAPLSAPSLVRALKPQAISQKLLIRSQCADRIAGYALPPGQVESYAQRVRVISTKHCRDLMQTGVFRDGSRCMSGFTQAGGGVEQHRMSAAIPLQQGGVGRVVEGCGVGAEHDAELVALGVGPHRFEIVGCGVRCPDQLIGCERFTRDALNQLVDAHLPAWSIGRVGDQAETVQDP